ncbi:MAG: protein kinase [Myxococcaceae bacterium]
MSNDADISAVFEPQPAGLHAGGYELLTRIATGGMGEVFVARKTGNGAFEKRVALKLLLPHLSQEPEFIRMFLDEARIAARMNHPNVVQIFDLGEAEGRYFIAMALIEGVSLAKLLRACQRMKAVLPLPIVRLIASGLCEALAHAHNLTGPNGEDFGTIHRDVNPSNVLLSTSGAVLLTDFGIAKAQGNLHATRTGHVMGKYAYMAPEQMRAGEPIDKRVDVYAAALTIYETLTGVSPFKRATDPEIIDAVRTERVPDPQRLRSEVGPEMAAALLRGTSPKRGDRHESVSELLERFMDGPVARPSELGQWVAELCPTDLERFRGATATSAPIASPRTRSLLLVDDLYPTVTPHEAPPKPGRWPLVAGAALLASGFVAAAVVFVDRGDSGTRPFTVERIKPGEPVDRAERHQITSPAPGARSGDSDEPTTVRVPAQRPITLEPELPAPAARADRTTPTRVLAQPPARSEAPKSAPARSRPVKKRSPPAAPAPATRKVAARPTRVGYLSADATPWASLWVDGKKIDLTPISRYPLPVGRQEVVFRNPELDKEVRRTVVIEEGKVVTLNVDLQR